MSKVGIAMIARNAEDLMPLALDPFVDAGVVDEVAIVLGGESTDNTPRLAKQYATLPVEPFDGPLMDDGRLMHFGNARNQSFDILRRAGCEFALVVDTDDQWQGVERLPTVLEQVGKGGFKLAVFPYSYQGGGFIQPRLYHLEAGHWKGPCHNYWLPNNGVTPTALHTDIMSIIQDRPDYDGKARRDQNIHISQEWMKAYGDNARLLLHLAKDCLVDRRVELATDALERFFPAFEAEGKTDPEELYSAYHTLAGIKMITGNYADALHLAFKALAVRPHAQSWTLASEAAGFVAHQGREQRPLLHLSEFCANMALEEGKSRNNLHWASERLTGSLPLFLKGRALAGLGEFRAARGALDLCMLVHPDHEEARQLRADICRQLGELP